MQKRLRPGLCFLFSVAIALVCLPCQCEPQRCITLTHAVDLPDLPLYTGRAVVFSTGLEYPDLPGGPDYILEFTTKDAPSMVINWYKDVMNDRKWKIKS